MSQYHYLPSLAFPKPFLTRLLGPAGDLLVHLPPLIAVRWSPHLSATAFSCPTDASNGPGLTCCLSLWARPGRGPKLPPQRILSSPVCHTKHKLKKSGSERTPYPAAVHRWLPGTAQRCWLQLRFWSRCHCAPRQEPSLGSMYLWAENGKWNSTALKWQQPSTKSGLRLVPAHSPLVSMRMHTQGMKRGECDTHLHGANHVGCSLS